MSVSLQPDDDVIQQIVAYSQETLHLDEPVAPGVPPQGQVGTAENIYLYGHGGTSAINVEDNDRFGRRSVGQLTAMLAPHIPADYTGTIFLIGCTTQPIVAGLRGALQNATGQQLEIRGTPEKLQTTGDGGIVLRRAPANDEVASMRESVDMGRRYYRRIIGLRKALGDSRQALGAAGDMPARQQAVLQVIVALEQLKEMNQEIRTGLEQLGPDDLPPKLEGRRNGLQGVRDNLASVGGQQEQLIDLLDEWMPLRLNNENFGTVQELQLITAMRANLQQARQTLNEHIQVLAVLTNVADEVLQGVPFQLPMMGQPAPPALVEEVAPNEAEHAPEEVEGENQGGGNGALWLAGLGLALGVFLVAGTILAKRR